MFRTILRRLPANKQGHYRPSSCAYLVFFFPRSSRYSRFEYFTTTVRWVADWVGTKMSQNCAIVDGKKSGKSIMTGNNFGYVWGEITQNFRNRRP